MICRVRGNAMPTLIKFSINRLWLLSVDFTQTSYLCNEELNLFKIPLVSLLRLWVHCSCNNCWWPHLTINNHFQYGEIIWLMLSRPQYTIKPFWMMSHVSVQLASNISENVCPPNNVQMQHPSHKPQMMEISSLSDVDTNSTLTWLIAQEHLIV